MIQSVITKTRENLPPFVKQPLRKLRWALRHIRSAYGGISKKSIFKDVEAYCMFLGYPRSGHSLVGSLIDAHQEAIIAHELDALLFLQKGFSKFQLFYLILENSQHFSQTGRVWTGYSYEVQEQWQGRFSTLKVIGDKKGGKSTLRLQSDPSLLQQLQKTVDLEIKYIHVTRNPFDNITTISRKSHLNLRQSIEYYFSLCNTISEAKKHLPTKNVFDIRLESIILNPQESMRAICQFLGLSVTQEYLESCSSVIFETPRKTRSGISWETDLIKYTHQRIEEFSFLDGYSYDE